MQNFYDAYDYKKSSTPQTQRGLDLLSWANPKDNEEILDVGCGDGRTTWHLFYANTNVKSITGIDISEDQIKAAKEFSRPNLPKNDEWKEKVHFVCGNFLDRNQLKDQEYDLIFSNTAVHWMGPDAYQRMFELLKENGRICVEQCGYDDLEALHDVCHKVINDMGLDYKFKGYEEEMRYSGCWFPTIDELKKLLTGIGFKSFKAQMKPLYFDKDFSEDGIYEAFIASCLYKYYDIINDEHESNEFKAKVRFEFYENTPPAHAKRITLKASKQEGTFEDED